MQNFLVRPEIERALEHMMTEPECVPPRLLATAVVQHVKLLNQLERVRGAHLAPFDWKDDRLFRQRAGTSHRAEAARNGETWRSMRMAHRDRVNVGIIGAGFIGHLHAEAFMHVPNAEVVAIASP